MPKYVLGHHLKGEGARLDLMSELLDPMHRRYIDALGVVRPGARTLEVGCGNGSISTWLAERVSPGGAAVAVDLDLSLIHVRMQNLEVRQVDILAGPVKRGAFDLVTARAVLHHIAEPQEVRAFWDGWLAWSRERGIDYHIGRTLAPRLASLGLTKISGTAETAIYNGGSLWGDYWIETITELRGDLIGSGKLDQVLTDRFLACCSDSTWWTQTIAFTAVHGRTLGG